MRSVFTLAVLAALVPALALAGPAPGTIMKVKPPRALTSPQDRCRQNFQLKVARIGQMAEAMNLTAAQKPLFDNWRKVRLTVDGAWPCPLPPIGIDVPTPKRLDNQIGVLRYELDALEREKPAAAALYDALTPEQRAIFDNPASAAPPAPDSPAPAGGVAPR